MTPTVLVTGATGTVGRHAVASLADREATVRIASRDPGSAGAVEGADEAVAFDFERPETWGDALDGVDALFLVRPPAVDASRIGEFAAAADRTGVERIVYLSTLGADRNVLLPHHRIERRIGATGAAHTFLRASYFMQNLLEVHRPEIVERDEIFVPAGDGATSFVDARDVGAVAAAALTEPGHEEAYDLTGPESLTYRQVAAVFSAVLGREITYPAPSVPAFVRRLLARGEPAAFVAVMVVIYTVARLGLAGRTTDDAARVLGRPPRDLRTFVADHADAFRPESGAGYVETREPPVPEAAYRVVNPVVSALLRSPLHSLLSDSLLLLTFTGRRSGEEYTTPVGYWERDGRLVVTTHSPWWRNLRGGQPVTVLLRGERREGIAVDGDREPTRAELEAGVEGTVVIEIDLDAPAVGE